MSSLSQLIQLQDIDNQLLELEQLKGDLPKSVEELSNQVNILNTSIERNEQRLKEIEVETRRIQGIITSYKTKVDKLQDQLYLVKTNREYDALMSEIDHLKSEINESEIRELELSEEKDRLEEQLKIDKLKLNEKSKELEIQREKLEGTITSTEKEQVELTDKRAALIPSIDVRHLAMYNRIRQARGGVAVVPVVNGACGGCHSKLTSQMLAEIRTGEKIITCSACRRFLYWEDNG